MVLLLIQPHQHDPQSDSRSISRLSPVKKSAIEVGMLQMVLLFIINMSHKVTPDLQ